ncbi:Leu/Phe/Val dehydrogenase [Gorillibacterium timonense]|uniref:Leu/Phe/Val dehydrogenase n=1 Tax=Gorillibacterium timonense TaxID=1689269 RepID=UPI00071CE84B|nr:Glu/Leu/Phe/Val dehydrogenase dimerization domain-containing protein [Gorillibacterium timonense]
MEIWAEMEREGCEQLVFFQDADSGMKAVVAIHNTKLGPALGGCRLRSYASSDEAVRDALRLAKGMTYKSALAGLPYGGGKAVVLELPDPQKRSAGFRSFGRFLEKLNGTYVTGLDLGTTVTDMDLIREETDYVTDTSGSLGAVGDLTAKMTAYGVFLAIREGLAYLNRTSEKQEGSDPPLGPGSAQESPIPASASPERNTDLAGITVAVQGVGKVGYFLCRYLHEAGAKLIASDVDAFRLARVAHEFGAVPVWPNRIYETECDVFAPCALGGILNDTVLPRLRCRLVAGAANNQLQEPQHGARLHGRGILYAPDYVINAGGIIVTAAELDGRSADSAKRQVERIPDTLRRVLAKAEASAIPPAEAADRLTERILERGFHREGG